MPQTKMKFVYQLNGQTTTSETIVNAGYESVAHLRRTLRERWGSNHKIENIEGGLRLTPKSGLALELYREITMI